MVGDECVNGGENLSSRQSILTGGEMIGQPGAIPNVFTSVRIAFMRSLIHG